MYSVYTLKEPNSEIVRYIGVSNNPTRRFKEHIKDKKSSYKTNWINKIKNLNKLPELTIIEENLTKKEALIKEIHYIKLFKSFGAKLTNGTIGGEAPMADKKHSKSTLLKMSEGRRGENNSFYGKHHSDKVKSDMSIVRKGTPSWNTGKSLSEEHKLKLSKVKKGKPPPNFGKSRFDFNLILELKNNGISQSEIAKVFKTDQGTISRIINKINYKY